MELIVGLTEWANTPSDQKVGSTRGWGGRGQLIRRDPETGRAEIVPVRIVADCEAQQQREMAKLARLQELAEAEGWG